MIGEFRYFETRREVGPVNIGQGLINPWAGIDPYCCVSSNPVNAPPSMSMNSTGSIWENLVYQTYFPRENDTYGFAVVDPGTINLNCAASNTGSIKWTLSYAPFDPGAAVTAA
jgi:hypothetical protein